MYGFADFVVKAIISPMSIQTHMALKPRMQHTYITHTQYAGTWEQNINILPLKHFCINSFTHWNQMQWHVHKGMPSIIRQMQHFTAYQMTLEYITWVRKEIKNMQFSLHSEGSQIHTDMHTVSACQHSLNTGPEDWIYIIEKS